MKTLGSDEAMTLAYSFQNNIYNKKKVPTREKVIGIDLELVVTCEVVLAGGNHNDN